MFRNLTLTALGAALALSVAIPAYAANPMVGGAEMMPDKTIVENAMNSADHTTLVEAVKAELPVWKLQVFGDGSEEWVGCA